MKSGDIDQSKYAGRNVIETSALRFYLVMKSHNI